MPVTDTTNIKTFAVIGALLLFGLAVFCWPTAPKVQSPNAGGEKYVAPWKNKPSKSPAEVQAYVDKYMKKNNPFMRKKSVINLD